MVLVMAWRTKERRGGGQKKEGGSGRCWLGDFMGLFRGANQPKTKNKTTKAQTKTRKPQKKRVGSPTSSSRRRGAGGGGGGPWYPSGRGRGGEEGRRGPYAAGTREPGCAPLGNRQTRSGGGVGWWYQWKGPLHPIRTGGGWGASRRGVGRVGNATK